MSALTVFLAPAGVCDGVYATLADLSAAGLIDRFGWVSEPVERTPVDRVVVVEQGRATEVGLRELVTARVTTVLRVCTLEPVFGTGAGRQPHRRLPIGAQTAATEVLAATTGAQRVVRMRCLLTRAPGIVAAGAELAVDGWHNIVVSPEDARGPDFGRVALGPDPTAAELGRYAAPVVAGLTGLWQGVHHAPLDDAPVLPGQVVRLARSFYRKLETGEVEAALRAEVLTQAGELPLPADQRSAVVYVNDVALASNTMADALWRKHAGVLRGQRLAHEQHSVERIGAWAVLKMFFGFLWASVKNAPGAWYRSMADGVSSRVALGVEKAVFEGAPAAYEVVVRGRTANGDYAGWAEIGAASGQLSGALDHSENLHDGAADLSAVWQDYTRAALTLADAGTRTSDLPPLQVGASRAIIARAQDVVPGPDQRFIRIPGVVAAAVQNDGVDATDPMGIRDLGQRLTELERSAEHGLQARAVLTDLGEWERRSSRSFGVAVGARLADAFHSCYGEVQELMERLRTASQPPEPVDQSHKLARGLQLGLVGLLVVTALLVYLAVEDIVVWWLALIVVLGLLLIGLGAGAFTFIRTQRHVFALLHRRRAVIDDFEVDRQNLRSALRDLRRLSQAYGQFLCWSRVLGSFLAAPLGPDHHQQTQSLAVGWGLPMSTAVGAATPAPDQVATAAGYVRRELFHLGWLGSSWENLVLSSLPPMPGSRETGAEASPVWSDPGRWTGSPLDRWSADLFSGAVTSTGAELVWQRGLSALTGPMSNLVPQLTGTVQVAGGPAVGLAEFLVQIDRDAAPAGTFDRSLLTDLAVTSAAADVVIDVRHRAWSGLGQICVATQLSEAIGIEALRRADTAADVRWDERSPAAPDSVVAQPVPAEPTSVPGPPGAGAATTRADEYRAPNPGGFGF